jgi:hypothetical protein
MASMLTTRQRGVVVVHRQRHIIDTGRNVIASVNEMKGSLLPGLRTQASLNAVTATSRNGCPSGIVNFVRCEVIGLGRLEFKVAHAGGAPANSLHLDIAGIGRGRSGEAKHGTVAVFPCRNRRAESLSPSAFFVRREVSGKIGGIDDQRAGEGGGQRANGLAPERM